MNSAAGPDGSPPDMSTPRRSWLSPNTGSINAFRITAAWVLARLRVHPAQIIENLNMEINTVIADPAHETTNPALSEAANPKANEHSATRQSTAANRRDGSKRDNRASLNDDVCCLAIGRRPTRLLRPLRACKILNIDGLDCQLRDQARRKCRPAREPATRCPWSWRLRQRRRCRKRAALSRMPPVICRRSAILHKAAASIVDLIFGVTVSTAERMATFGHSTPRAWAHSMAF